MANNGKKASFVLYHDIRGPLELLTDEQRGNFINDRILANRPLLVTTNLTGKELTAPPDMRYARIFDRILVMCPRPVILTGQSRRVDQRQERAAEMKRILGV